MWEKTGRNIDVCKRVIDRLAKIWNKKEFFKEILYGLENNIEGCEKLIEHLDKYSGLVPSEVYEYVSEITQGTFTKVFSESCTAKNKCIENPCDENWRELFTVLNIATLYYPNRWELTEEELKAMKEAGVGNTFHAETEIEPILLQDPKTGRVIIPVYTSEYEIPKKYHEHPYGLQETGWGYAKVLLDSCNENIGETCIVLDFDSDKYLEINAELIEAYEKNKSKL